MLTSRPRTHGDSHPADAQWNVFDRPAGIQFLQFVHLDGNAGWAGEEDTELGHHLRAFRHTRNRPSTAVHETDTPFLGARQLWWLTISAFEQAQGRSRRWPSSSTEPDTRSRCRPSRNASCAEAARRCGKAVTAYATTAIVIGSDTSTTARGSAVRRRRSASGRRPNRLSLATWSSRHCTA
ncbi:hypothetical protein GCM10023259_039260 [Thermocatellispora tengchongensis]